MQVHCDINAFPEEWRSHALTIRAFVRAYYDSEAEWMISPVDSSLDPLGNWQLMPAEWHPIAWVSDDLSGVNETWFHEPMIGLFRQAG